MTVFREKTRGAALVLKSVEYQRGVADAATAKELPSRSTTSSVPPRCSGRSRSGRCTTAIGTADSYTPTIASARTRVARIGHFVTLAIAY